jgi:hypothetical protein
MGQLRLREFEKCAMVGQQRHTALGQCWGLESQSYFTGPTHWHTEEAQTE